MTILENNNIINELEVRGMNSSTLFKVEGGFSFVTTTESSNVKVLQKAAEKYEVNLPKARFIVIYTCNSGMLECYHELEGYGVTEYAFGVEGQSIGIDCGSEDEEEIRKRAMDFLVSKLDDMYWGGILKEYLLEEGIYYEEV